MLGIAWPLESRYWLMFAQRVGTAREKVTASSLISFTMAAASKTFAPGNTSLAPTIAALYGMPQAFTWNIGTIGITTSRARSPTLSAMFCAMPWRTALRWLVSTPLGLPVVPEV
ncbi:hypothetical protein D3C84_144150 [compost metagenome]